LFWFAAEKQDKLEIILQGKVRERKQLKLVGFCEGNEGAPSFHRWLAIKIQA